MLTEKATMKKIQENFNEAECELTAAAYTNNENTRAEATVTAQIYVARRLREVTDDLISSNENLARSTDRSAKALNFLTLGLVLVGILQAVIIWRVSSTP